MEGASPRLLALHRRYNQQLTNPSIASDLTESTHRNASYNTRTTTIFKMSAQPDNQKMEGVQEPTTDVKGKGKAQEGETVEESMDDDSSDESGVEDQVRLLRSPLRH